MAVFTPGVSLVDSRPGGERISPQKLNDLIDLATFTGLGYSNFAGGTGAVFIYGNVAPPLRRGLFWYDTNAGSEGLKYAFVSASAGSVSKWLYLTPRREFICWTDSAVSMGYPLWVGIRNGLFYHQGLNGRIYDGCWFPSAWYETGETLIHPLLVIPTEHAGASQPVTCVWAGFAQGIFGNSPLASGRAAWIDLDAMGSFKDSTPITNKSQAHGVQGLSTGAAVTSAPIILWGTGAAYEDRA